MSRYFLSGEKATPGIVVGVGGDPYRGMALGDLDGDGRLDIVTPNPTEAGVLLNASGERTQFRVVPSLKHNTQGVNGFPIAHLPQRRNYHS